MVYGSNVGSTVGIRLNKLIRTLTKVTPEVKGIIIGLILAGDAGVVLI